MRPPDRRHGDAGGRPTADGSYSNQESLTDQLPADLAPVFVDVAVPLPLQQALTYQVPPRYLPLARVGARTRVRVGSRRLTGTIMALRDAPPAGVRPRPIEEIVDLIPIFPPELLELARFVAEYYLAPIGEVVKGMLPGDLPAWGSRKVRLTNQGALSRPRSPQEKELTAVLLETGRITIADLHARIPMEGFTETLEGLEGSGRVVVEDPSAKGGAYVTAVELPPGDLGVQLEACGRSAAGRAVVEYLAALGRPDTVRETTTQVGCSPGVVKRLIAKGVLRSFTQRNRLSLEHHVLAREPDSPITLRPDQAEAAKRLLLAVEAKRYTPFLLAGMTGSGKTEVYLRAVASTLEQGRSAILLVPEIALVPALARAVRDRFGEQLSLLHSAMGRTERRQEWEKIRAGAVRIVLGPRSAIFAPVRDLGLVVVDEEQDPSYKQDTNPRYNGRDIALVRCRSAAAVALLVSATPSLETRLNVERGRFQGLELTSRVGHGSLPEGILVDLKAEPVPRRAREIQFSARLRDEIRQTLEAGDQAILLRNRRGYAPLLLCRACGEDQRCDLCGLPRTYHRRERKLLCHYCGSTRPVPTRCPSCDREALEPIGAGTERIDEQVRELFPGIEVDVLDRDAVRRRGGAAAVLEKFGSGKTQILVGTQMVSKGHHFPRVALTAVLSADTYLGFPDFRAVERTYTLLTQLAGRAGRGEKPGRVVIQTYYPEHYAIRAALTHDDAGFAQEEMRFRRIFHYPPYSRMVHFLVRDRNQERARQRIRELADRLSSHKDSAGVRVLGPAPAPLEKLKGYWRYQLLLRSASGSKIRRLAQAMVEGSSGSHVAVDVDPYDLL